MNKKQQQMPLVEALRSYQVNQPLRLHVPGHGGGRGLLPAQSPNDWRSWDVTELNGLDDLHRPQGAIKKAQQLAADLYQARQSFFLVNGTTVGIQALIATCCGEKDQIVLPRNCHRSVLAGLILSGAWPIFVEPDLVPGFELAASYGGDKLEPLLKQNPGVRAVLAVHPNYYGLVGDLAQLAQVCHRFNVPLLVDEAHGTHLRFHPYLPEDGLSQGADAVVQSVHKTGGALTQSSWLHIGGSRIDEKKLAGVLQLLQTSSPSYLLMASLDAARQQLALKGQKMMQNMLQVMQMVVEQLNNIPGVAVLNRATLGSSSSGAYDHDPTRLVISVRGLGKSGYEVSQQLRQDHYIYVEMADTHHIVMVPPLNIDLPSMQRLVDALTCISRKQNNAHGDLKHVLPTAPHIPPSIITPRQAWLASKQAVPLEDAAGLIGGEVVAVHPPGHAIIYPGEEITLEVIEYLTQVRQNNLICHGASDTSLKTIAVVV